MLGWGVPGGVVRSGNSLNTWDTTQLNKPLLCLFCGEVTDCGTHRLRPTLPLGSKGSGGGGAGGGDGGAGVSVSRVGRLGWAVTIAGISTVNKGWPDILTEIALVPEVRGGREGMVGKGGVGRDRLDCCI